MEQKIILETDRLFLREMNMDDLDALYKVLADKDIMQHYPYDFDEERVRSWIDRNMNRYRENGFGLWAVCLRDTEEMIGDCGLTLQNIEGQMLPEIGYHIRADRQRKGYAKEAAAAVRDWAFANTDYPALYSYCKYTNVGSYKTAEAIGMHFEKEYPDPDNKITRVSVIYRNDNMVTHIGTQTIETERLILRRFEYSDIDSMIRNWIADEKTQWDYGEPCYPTPESVRELFDTKYIASYSKDDYYRWAVLEKGTGECIGQIAFFTVDTANRHAEIEYVIGPAFQGKGYATEMTRAVIAFGFDRINLHRIEIDCRTENTASQRVIEKCGLKYEGVFRDFFWRKDHYEGRQVFSILKQEWTQSKC